MRMGWSSNEDLVCILEEGTMATYNIHGLLHYSRSICRVSNFIYMYYTRVLHIYGCMGLYWQGLKWMNGLRIIRLHNYKEVWYQHRSVLKENGISEIMFLFPIILLFAVVEVMMGNCSLVSFGVFESWSILCGDAALTLRACTGGLL